MSFSPILIFHLENCGRSGKFHAVTVFFGAKHVEKKHWFYMIKSNNSNKIYVNGPVYVPIIYYILYAFLQIVLCVSVSHYQTLDSCALAKFPATKDPSLGSTKCEIFSFGIKKIVLNQQFCGTYSYLFCEAQIISNGLLHCDDKHYTSLYCLHIFTMSSDPLHLILFNVNA